jgi:hypothetical protein
MAFDNATRGRLQRFVTDARALLASELANQFQQDYGLDPASGAVAALSSLAHLDDQRLETARILREILDHYLATEMGEEGEARKAVLGRMVREQAFTTLNRLAALRMMEARGLVMECVGKGYQSKAFQLYQRVAGTGLGETGDTYRVFMLSLCDLYSEELPLLFDRHYPNGRLFPREPALLPLLQLINAAEIEPLWAEDETIGWIYQYFNGNEERKTMRDSSQAPRNSRELAVRNQFFTPRYVVEFLVDNTLGRLWFNWTGGLTGLRDRCEYLMVNPGDASEPARRLRDPRTIKLLDPACGSMHFGLYAFDLFLDIYHEAWAWEQNHGPGSLDVSTQPHAGFKPLCHTYTDENAFRRDVPRLILTYNIYGVDIDPRAAQIASLALWLRSQRAWNEAGVRAVDRPQVGRGQVVAAVAPPAEADLRSSFMQSLDPLDAALFEKTLFLLKRLPELGILLQIEREMPRLTEQVYGRNLELLREHSSGKSWAQIDADLRTALTAFAQAARSTYQGLLFSRDALEGLRVIDLTREVFDVIVMNPPFGDRITSTESNLERDYGDGKLDLYHYFYLRADSLLARSGLIGAITPRTALYQSRYEKLREHWLASSSSPLCVTELGLGILDDATVRPSLIVIGKNIRKTAFYCNLKHSKNPQIELIQAIRDYNGGTIGRRCAVQNLSRFLSMPGKRLSLWAPHAVLDRFGVGKTLEPAYGKVTEGLTCEDDARFIRCWWEVIWGRDSNWVPFGKYDSRSTFVPDFSMVIDWSPSGYKALGSLGNKRANESLYFKAGFAFTRSCEVGMACTTLPSGVVFAGVSRYFIPRDDINYGLLSYINTRLSEALHVVLTPDRDRISGTLRKLPVVINGDILMAISAQGQSIWKRKEDWIRSADETYRNYHDLMKGIFEFGSLQRKIDNFLNTKKNISVVEDEIEREVERLSGFSEDDLDTLREEVEERAGERDLVCWNADFSSSRRWAGSVISVAVGLLFGRWDIRWALGQRSSETEADPFGPIPHLPPGMLLSNDGSLTRSTDDLPPDYPISPCYDGIMAGVGSSKDNLSFIVQDIISLLCTKHSLNADGFERDLCCAIEHESIESYINSNVGFFKDHIRQYTKCKRAAPIYWPLSTPSGGYTLWVYYPGLTSQTLYTAINNFVEPKLKQVRQDAGALRGTGAARSRDEDRALEALQTLEQELIALRDTLLQIAPAYRPNHDDGVQITAAPLWQLFRHRPWQSLLKETWAKLEKGEYDWAHLAMAYWPDRVREKCKTDKSLAIAHDLEHLYVLPESKAAKPRGRRKKAAEA